MKRRTFRNSRDPQFQGDGWRWTLSFWLPEREIDPSSWPLVAKLFDGGRFDRDLDGIPVIGPWLQRVLEFWSVGPERICNLPLTADQRAACWAEWEAFTQDQARQHLGRDLSPFELDVLAAR
jgi:hypothetical protein